MIFHVETLRIQTYCEDPMLHRGNVNLNLKNIYFLGVELEKQVDMLSLN